MLGSLDSGMWGWRVECVCVCVSVRERETEVGFWGKEQEERRGD